VTKKSDLTAKLLGKIPAQYPIPEPLEGASLVEQGLYAVLLRRLTPNEAADTLARLRRAYSDWNELRVSQAQEINEHLALGPKGIAVCHDVREYLQEVFQRSHGMDLEFLREDAQATQRFVSILPFIGMGGAHYLLWIAGNRELPVTPALVRVLDRIGLISRTASVKKARTSIEPLVPDGRALEFAVKLGEIASRWCDARKPACHLCVLVDECKFGKKAFRDWKVQQERLEQQRARDAARLAVLQKKEDERRRKEDDKRKKKAAVEAAKRLREADRQARIAERKRKAEEQRQARLKAIADAKQRRIAEAQRKKVEAEERKKALARRKIEDQKKAEAKRKAEAKKKAAAAAAAKKKKAAAKKRRR
jgi:endonuclease III